MSARYFSDRERGVGARVVEEVDANAWGGIIVLIRRLIENGAFGIDFPEQCPDNRGPIGTDEDALELAIRAEVPGINCPLDADLVPDTLAVMDLVEFCHDHVADPIQRDHHSFFGHYHLRFDRERGQQEFRENVERLFSRNRLAFELKKSGSISRLAGPICHETLISEEFNTGDQKLNSLLEFARSKFLDVEPMVRREGIEKLWDAWERVKTLEEGTKKASIRTLLDRAAAEPRFRELLDAEARALTDVGNQFHIRHSEVGQTEIESDHQVDYLFLRLFVLIRLILRTR